MSSLTEKQAYLDGMNEAEEICLNSLHSQAAALIRVVAQVQRKTWGMDKGPVAAPDGTEDWLNQDLVGHIVMSGGSMASRVESAMRRFKSRKEFMEADTSTFISLPNCGRSTAAELEMIQGILIKDFNLDVAF